MAHSQASLIPLKKKRERETWPQNSYLSKDTQLINGKTGIWLLALSWIASVCSPRCSLHQTLPRFVPWRIGCGNFINELLYPRLPIGFWQRGDWWRARSGYLALDLPSHGLPPSAGCLFWKPQPFPFHIFSLSFLSCSFLPRSGNGSLLPLALLFPNLMWVSLRLPTLCK